jgi:hypothetical protein
MNPFNRGRRRASGPSGDLTDPQRREIYLLCRANFDPTVERNAIVPFEELKAKMGEAGRASEHEDGGVRSQFRKFGKEGPESGAETSR